MDEGDREGGKDENEGWRWRATGCWLCDEDEGGCCCEEDGGCGLCAITCMAAKAIVSIFSQRPRRLSNLSVSDLRDPALGVHQGHAFPMSRLNGPTICHLLEEAPR